MSRVQCFWVEPANRARRSLRRFRWSSTPCQKTGSYCNAHTALDEVTSTIVDGHWDFGPDPKIPHDDPRWPKNCEACGYAFTHEDEYQVFHDPLWRDPKTGFIYSRRDNPVGMMYDAFWNHDYKPWCGPDGKSIHVICPDGHDWCIDSECSNCTMPEDKVHKCWVRHGEPPMLTVDKNGFTCKAGAGSIQTPTWHGFLTNGILSEQR